MGAGVVGKATGLGFMHHGNEVTFVDVNEETLDALRKEGFRARSPKDMNLSGIDAVFVSVTALTGEDGIDLTHLLQATQQLSKKLAKVKTGFPVIVFRCTMPPGTIRDVLIPLLERHSGKRCDEDFGVVYNPEYLRAASSRQDFLHPRVITLSSLEEGDRAHKLVHEIVADLGAAIHWLPFEAAEFQKYVNNVGNAIKISTYNWFRMLADKLEISEEHVEKAFELSVASAESLWNPSYGTRNFGPYGGACLPKDIKALKYFSSKLGIDTGLLDAVQDINTSVEKGARRDDA